MTLELRNYQLKAKQAVETRFSDGINKQVLVLATGAGKTIIFSHLIRDLIAKTGKKALVIAHRKELLTQSRDKLLRVDPGLKIELERAEDWADFPSADVVVASVQTIGYTNSQRIKRFDPNQFCIVVVDEAHHCAPTNTTYANALRHLGLFKPEPENDWNKGCLLLGVTATPQRSGHEGLDKTFDEVVFTYPIIQAIQEKWLSRIKAYRVDTTTDLAGIKKTAGDFNLGELGDRVNNEERNKLVVKAYLERVPYHQALCFAVDVAHTQALTQEFILQGVRANYIVGSTDPEERTQIIADFKAKKIQVLINCQVLTEGFDEESVEVIILARPTQSAILFVQMVGRGTRLAEGKDYLTILDICDNTYRQNLQTSSSLIGIPGKVDFQGEDILTMKEQLDKLLELAPNTNLDKLDIKKIQYAIEEVDILSGLKIPDELEGLTPFEWHKYGENTYRIGLGDYDRAMILTQTITGQFDLTGIRYDRVKKTESETPLGSFASLKGALAQTDKYITDKFPKAIQLIATTARWHKQPLSQPQADLLRKLRVNETVIASCDRGTGSKLITKLLNNQHKRPTI